MTSVQPKKEVSPSPDVIPEEYPDEDMVVEEQDNNEEQTKQYSPEACMARLAKLPENVQNELKSMTEYDCFNSCVQSLVSRCAEQRKNMEENNFERMWTHNVRNHCMNFRQQCFRHMRNRSNGTYQVFTDYMSTLSVMEMLQTLVDLAQQRGFFAKQNLASCMDENGALVVSETDYAQSKEQCTYCYNQYHFYVDLYRHCNGSWRPRRNNRSNGEMNNRQAGQDRQERPVRQKQMYQGQNKSTQQTDQNQGRRVYNPGTYRKNDGSNNEYQSSRQNRGSEQYRPARTQRTYNQNQEREYRPREQHQNQGQRREYNQGQGPNRQFNRY